MSQWIRLWSDMPNDPKWRVVARRAGRPVSEVLAVFVHMMTNAGSATDRGSLEAWTDEDVAIAIDGETEHVKAIREAMQGKTLEGDRLTGWEKRQPKREDGGAERAKQWREAKRTHPNAPERTEQTGKRTQTLANAPERPEEMREDKNRDSCPKPVRTRNRYPDDFEEFWSAYPTDANMGKREAFAEWQKLDDEEHRQATASCPSFVAHCKADPTYRPIHANRYLAKRRFEGHAAAQTAKARDGQRIDFGGGIVWPETTVRSQLAHFRRDPSTWPTDRLGPPPGTPGCRVPDRLLEVAA